MNKRLHVRFEGNVQGVGFRLAAERIASSVGIVGWVKNMSDGAVEAVCEGAENSLNDFLAKIQEVFGRYIRDSRVEWSVAKGDFDNFDIRF